jgi:hypothetical protein
LRIVSSFSGEISGTLPNGNHQKNPTATPPVADEGDDRVTRLAADTWAVTGGPRLVDARVASDISCGAGLVDPGVQARARTDVSCGPGLVDARIASDVSCRAWLVDPRVHAGPRTPDVSGRPRLVDAWIAPDVSCPPGLVDAGITRERDVEREYANRTGDQCAHECFRKYVHFSVSLLPLISVLS